MSRRRSNIAPALRIGRLNSSLLSHAAHSDLHQRLTAMVSRLRTARLETTDKNCITHHEANFINSDFSAPVHLQTCVECGAQGSTDRQIIEVGRVSFFALKLDAA
jgi:hypothetical protein